MTDPATDASEKPFLPRWVLFAAIPGFLGPLLILGFIFVSEYLHDESRCPYVAGSVQTVKPDVTVVEESRRCMPGVEERRYTLRRSEHRQILGRRRFPAAAFGEGYRWQALFNDKGEVQVNVHNPGHEDASFRDGTAKKYREVAGP